MSSVEKILAGLLIAVTSLNAYAKDPELRGDRARSADVWSAFTRWTQAYDKGDMQGIMAIFDADVVFMFQGAQDQSYAELRAGYEADLKSRSPGASWVPLVDEVYADGNLAFVRAVWELHVASPDGKFEVKERNRSMDFLRNRDGRWQLYRSINYPLKAPG
jgi:uncharacterized protein (TIGR02246 family)